MDPAVFQRRWHEADVFMKHSMDVADQQLQRQKFFALEHPRTATSWKLPCVEKISLHGQVQKVHFDQCMLGLHLTGQQKDQKEKEKLDKERLSKDNMTKEKKSPTVSQQDKEKDILFVTSVDNQVTP